MALKRKRPLFQPAATRRSRRVSGRSPEPEPEPEPESQGQGPTQDTPSPSIEARLLAEQIQKELRAWNGWESGDEDEREHAGDKKRVRRAATPQNSIVIPDDSPQPGQNESDSHAQDQITDPATSGVLRVVNSDADTKLNVLPTADTATGKKPVRRSLGGHKYDIEPVSNPHGAGKDKWTELQSLVREAVKSAMNDSGSATNGPRRSLRGHQPPEQHEDQNVAGAETNTAETAKDAEADKLGDALPLRQLRQSPANCEVEAQIESEPGDGDEVMVQTEDGITVDDTDMASSTAIEDPETEAITPTVLQPQPQSQPKPATKPRNTRVTRASANSQPHLPFTLPENIDPCIPEVVRSTPYSGTIRARSQLATHLQPLHNLNDIFKSLTSRALELGLQNVLNHLGNRKLRVATVCSGTESPLLALEMVKENLQKHFGLDLPFKHLFSAEIVPFKQAYIERNFHPKLIFRDVAELKDRVAQTAYGTLSKVPKNADILVAGFACVDFSPLNNHRKTLDESGESGGTFWGIFRHCEVYRPRLVILENVKKAPWEEIEKHWNNIDYVAVHAIVDTKAYYLPQTRERGYMLCVDKRVLKKSDMGEEDVRRWTSVLEDFKRPASSPAGMFLLDADDRRIEQIEKSMAIKIEASSARATVSWDRYRVIHQDYRLRNGLGHRRPVTRYQDNGTCRMVDFAWHAWAKSLPERVWDTIEMNFLRKLVDGYDMNYKERCLELSQGIDRDLDSRAYGIIGCITPTGNQYMTTRGGPFCGLELLALQGLPLERLLLTQESQREIQDLAGNAMSSTVVGAAILSALIVGHKVLLEGDSHLSDADHPAFKHKNITPQGQSGLHLISSSIHLDAAAVNDIAELYDQAASSQRHCICEGQNSTRVTIVKCTLCSHTACSECSGNPQHAYERCAGLKRTEPLDFISLLQSAMPARLVVGGITRSNYDDLQSTTSIPSDIWSEFLDAVFLAVGDELRFSDVKRSEVWTAVYEGKHAVLKLVIDSGGLNWLLFAKPRESDPALCLMREILSKPIARKTVPRSGPGSTLAPGLWEICAPLSSCCSLELFGSGSQIESYESKCGLELEGFKDSQVWTHINVQGNDEQVEDLEVDIRGTYELLQDCGTANACLHRKLGADGQPVVYLFLDPTKLNEPKNDSFVFALEHRRNPGYSSRLTIAEVSRHWRSSKATDQVEPVDIYYRKWIDCETASIKPYTDKFDSHVRCFGRDECTPISIQNHECHSSNVTLLAFIASASFVDIAAMKTEWEISDPVDSPQILREYAWLVQKFARHTDFSRWSKVSKPEADEPCSVCLPSKPGILWGLDARGRIKAYEDPYDAARYERQIKSRPASFLLFRKIDAKGRAELRITLNIQTLLHQAYGRLADPYRASFHWRLVADSQNMQNSPFPKFSLKSNRNDIQSLQPPNFQKQLRPEQLRSLSWMIQQEDDNIDPFIQEETEEALLDSLMWRAEGKVTVEKTVRGGVLADDVGYGKTAIVLGLIDMLSDGLDVDLSASLNKDGFIPSKATLIVVPKIMVQQWQSEIIKFLGNQYKVRAFSSAAALKKINIEEMRHCDIILVSWGVFDTGQYYQHLQKYTGASEAPEKPGRSFDDWFHRVHALMKDHIRALAKQGPGAFLESLRDRRMQTAENGESQRYTPSKRLRGKHYVQANQDRDDDAKNGVSYTEISSGDEDSEVKEVNPEDLKAEIDKLLQLLPSDPSGKTEEPKNKKEGICCDGKEFGIAAKGKRQHWETVKGLPFHAFHFKRLVIDEFTYAKAERLTQLLKLQADSKWVLSGTPPLNDFADVNTIAPFLGVHLGIDADDDVNPSNSRLKDLRKQRTDAEAFESFRAPRSEAWHRRRHEIAQTFLDRFARRNVAELDEIPSTEHIMLVGQSPAEKVVYLELYKQLMQYNLQLRRSNSRGFDSDQVNRLDDIISKSSSMEEALLKRCASFASTERWDGNGNPEAATCVSLIRTREEQLEKLKKQLKEKLKLAAWLHCACDQNTEESSFDSFRGLIQCESGDLSVTEETCSLLETAIAASSPRDWKDFFADQKAKREDGETDSNARERTTKVLPQKPTQEPERLSMLRGTTTFIRKLVVEWVSRKRALRFLNAVRQIQANPQDVPSCDRCQNKPRGLAGINILGSCGHALCAGCTLNIFSKEECAVEGCRGSGKKFNIINASTLGSDTINASSNDAGVSETDVDTSSKHGGTKLDVLIGVCRNIPPGERALLFIQFTDLMGIASKALTAAKIKHTSITSSDHAGSHKIEQFQKNGPGDNKVLLLNLGSEMAAGLNLQCANHIIFLSPFHAQTKYDYESTMTQAIGRCRRYGQTKHVHIYHLLAKRTIDVDIFQERREKVLVERDGQAELVDAEEALENEMMTCQGPKMVV